MPSAEPDNIQVFNFFVLKVLTQLYDKFPEPVEVKGVDFLVQTFHKGRRTIETKYFFLFPHTMTWLREEGFVKFESGSANGHFKNVTLTLRGLTILGYVPQCLGRGRKKTIAERARHALSKGVGEAVSDVAKTLIVEGLKFMLQ